MENILRFRKNQVSSFIFIIAAFLFLYTMLYRTITAPTIIKSTYDTMSYTPQRLPVPNK